MLIVSPLVGLAFQSDQRTYIYLYAHRIGANPFRALRKVVDDLGGYIRLGNFRPFGRFLVYLEESGRFELGVATGIPPNIVQGLVRLLMIGLLALSATLLISTLYKSVRSTVKYDTGSPGIKLTPWQRLHPEFSAFPIILASTLVVIDTHHPISLFPFFLILITIAIILIPLYFTSDTDLKPGILTRRELVTVVLIGVCTTTTYELLYLTPIVILAILVLRFRLSRRNISTMIRSKAFSKYSAFLITFMLVFLPSRLLIARQCSIYDCYEGSRLVVSGLSIKHWLGRTLSGSPFYSWIVAFKERDLRDSSLDRLVETHLLGNMFFWFVAASLLALAIYTAKQLTRRRDYELPISIHLALGTAFIAIGLIFALFPTLAVSLTANTQRWHQSGWGLNQWRETLLVQIGWAFILYGLIAILLVPVNRLVRRVSLVWRWVVYVLICMGLYGSVMATFVANYSYGLNDRSDQYSNTHNMVATAIVDFDRSEQGNHLRCILLSNFPDSGYNNGTILAKGLNELSRSRYGQAFCLPP